MLPPDRNPRPFLVLAPVQTDRTAESMAEISPPCCASCNAAWRRTPTGASWRASRAERGLTRRPVDHGPEPHLAAVEAVLDEELGAFLESGPTAAELARAQTRRRASFVRGVERIGGFGGKSDVLAMSEVYLGRPDGHLRTQQTIIDATPADVRAAAGEWLSRGGLTVEVRPFPDYAAGESDVDRSSGPPEVTDFPSASFPARETTRLSNGLDVILARRDAVPVVDFNLLLDAGYAADQLALPGTARMTMDMLDEGTASRSALEIAEELEGLGTTLFTGSNLDNSTVRMSTLKENLDASLDLFADVVLEPRVPEPTSSTAGAASSSRPSPASGSSPSGWRCASSRASSTARATPTASP